MGYYMNQYFVIILIYFLPWTYCFSTVQVPTYNAAVLEHEYIASEQCLRIKDYRKQATCIKLENLDIYEEHVKEAAKQEAEIIVFPEQGLHGHLSRAAAPSFAEDIPEPGTDWCPCQNNDSFTSHPAQYRFSCMANKYKMYVVGECIDHQTRDANGTAGDFYYNTGVAYDLDGCLIARYHKENLFGFEQSTFNKPARPNFSFFDTHFGRVGLFICFDILFKTPAYDLVEEYNITDIVFPTAWIDALPMYSAVGTHNSWAMGMGVNFLSSNYRIARHGMLGSGIYSPTGPLAFTRNRTSLAGSILLVTEVPRIDIHAPVLPSTFPKSNFSLENSHQTFDSLLFYDQYTFTAIISGSDKKTICQNDFCCKLHFEAVIPNDEFYAFGVFHGLHTAAQQYLHMQNCVVLKCASNEHSSCGQPVRYGNAKFHFLSLTGSFSAKYVFPTVLTDNVQLASLSDYEFNRDKKCITSKNGIKEPLVFASLHGRIYDVKLPLNTSIPT